ncbi:MAG: GatB/YqeY domain-containing protein [Solirubrobacterales bacterium]|nr:GatB/YqeY domain-containing protein [Solirubrobacterales bacterium]
MAVVEQVQEDARAALKAGDRERAGALRLIAAELQRAAKDAVGGGDVDEVAVLQRERKRRLESAAAYRDGGRSDLAAGEEAEAELIAGYLPAQLDDAELAELVDAAIAETGASSPRDMGAVMKLLVPRVAGRADGRRVSAAVKERLAG